MNDGPMHYPPDFLKDLGAFIELSKKKFGESNTLKFLPALSSILSKFRFAELHAVQATKLIQPDADALRRQYPEIGDNVRSLFHVLGENSTLKNDLFAASAHVVAFAQCIHCTADYLAKVVYYGLDLDGWGKYGMERDEVGMTKLFLKMQGRGDGKNKMSGIYDALSGYDKSPEAKYLSAFTNTEKHHELIRQNARIRSGLNNEMSVEVTIEKFEYQRPKSKLESHDAKSVSEFLTKDFQAIVDHTANVAKALCATIPKLP